MTTPAAIADLISIVRDVGEWEERSWFPPGSQLAVCLSGDKNRLADLSDAELVEMAAAAHRQAAWAQARELAAIAELAHRRTQAEAEGDPDYRVLPAHESVVEEVATALTVTGNAAATLVHLADRLTTDLPGTREALETGRLDLPKVRAIVELTDALPDGIAERVEAAVLDHAPHQTTGQLRRRIRRAVHRLAPQHLEDRKQQAIIGRALELWETPEGTANLTVTHLDPGDAHAIHQKITAAARALRTDGDPRALDQIRVDLATRLLRGATLPDAIRTLLAHDTESDTAQIQPASTAEPAGPAGRLCIPAAEPVEGRERDALVGALAALVGERLTAVAQQARAYGRLDGLALQVTRAVQDLQGRLGGIRDSLCRVGHADAEPGAHGHPGYRPPAAMRRLVEARHATCVFPTCGRPSRQCDLDHTIPYGKGVTCSCNLAPLCRRHHRTKQTSGWKLAQIWPGLLIWITPSGKWCIVLPDRQ